MIAALDHSEEAANSIRTFWFRPERPADYTAGQFIEMVLPHEKVDDRGQKRWFTLSSSPTEELISITTRHDLSHASTFKKALFSLKPGSRITISEPMGDFVLPKDITIPLIFVAGGIGITPVRSMVKWLFDKAQRRHVHIIYSARQLNDLAFTDLFELYGARVDIILSEPAAGWTGQIGQLDADTILRSDWSQQSLMYISGPEPMVERLETGLISLGVPASRLVPDFFPGYKAVL